MTLTADQLNTASEARAAGMKAASGPLLCAQVLRSTQLKLAAAVEAHRQALLALQAAESTLRSLGSDAATQAAWELALARGDDRPPPASREIQAARVRGLTRLADEAQARVAHLSHEASAHRRAVVASLMPQALQAYKDAADALAARYADILSLQQHGATTVLLNGNPLRVPSAAGLPEPGGSGILASTTSVVDSGGLGAAEQRMDAEIERLLSLLKHAEVTA